VAPWRSAFKFHLLNDAEIIFVLANGGHNAGITSDALLVKVKDGKVQSKMPLEDFHKVIRPERCLSVRARSSPKWKKR
jgi:hypothetical protein